MEKEQGRSMSITDESQTVNATNHTPDGKAVLKEVVQMTGLPEEYLNVEISDFLGTANTRVNDLTLDQLRSIMLNYLETVNEEMTQQLEKH